MTLSRRTLIASSVMAGACGLFAKPALAQSRKLVLGTFGGVFETALKTMGPDIAKAGYELELAIGSSQLTLTKLQAARERSPFDAVMMTAEAMLTASEKGLLRPVTAKEIPGVANIQPRLLKPFEVPDGYASTPLHWKALGILWRKDLVPFEITSWHDLWRPELKGRISVQNMPTLGAASILITAAIINGGSASNLEPGWKAMQALRPNIRDFYAISSNALTSLVAGDTWATVNVADLGIPLASRNVVATVPKEGAPYSPEGLGFPKNPPSGDLAFGFADFMLQPQQQTQWASLAKVAPSIAMEVPASLKSEIVENDAILGSLLDINFLEMGQRMPAWADRWRKEIVG
ncbi:MAG: extracellular solute-binding protein [Chelatococcus sp.]|uniref:ABC transporter substrate-binding protein n=1 Tax=Chelatococcus sp. TaxID=1953771 RepID=UPI0025B9DF4F|nr:extracellular solute-binding protein [Chelatococcus sp.]MBX3540137.1 extracellular solute-binding protein [Chelatococcus sp.]